MEEYVRPDGLEVDRGGLAFLQDSAVQAGSGSEERTREENLVAGTDRAKILLSQWDGEEVFLSHVTSSSGTSYSPRRLQPGRHRKSAWLLGGGQGTACTMKQAVWLCGSRRSRCGRQKPSFSLPIPMGLIRGCLGFGSVLPLALRWLPADGAGR